MSSCPVAAFLLCDVHIFVICLFPCGCCAVCLPTCGLSCSFLYYYLSLFCNILADLCMSNQPFGFSYSRLYYTLILSCPGLSQPVLYMLVSCCMIKTLLSRCGLSCIKLYLLPILCSLSLHL